MASGLVRSALSSILDEFSKCSDRSKTSIQEVKIILDKIPQEVNVDHFDKFAEELMDVLQRISSPSDVDGKKITHVMHKERLWRDFHAARLSELPDLWRKFLEAMKVTLDPLVQQSVNQKLFEELVKSLQTVSSSYTSGSITSTIEDLTISAEEENIIRYAAGFVPFALLKKHEKSKSASSAAFIDCLIGMAVNGNEGSFLEYTTQWIHDLNRGGLFEVNDTAYVLFQRIEACMRDNLKIVLKPTASRYNIDNKEKIIDSVCIDSDVQFYWSILSADTEEEEHAASLLKEIVELWLTLRGYSIAGQWMEIYKNCTKMNPAKNKSLRKELKN